MREGKGGDDVSEAKNQPDEDVGCSLRMKGQAKGKTVSGKEG